MIFRTRASDIYCILACSPLKIKFWVFRTKDYHEIWGYRTNILSMQKLSYLLVAVRILIF